MGTSLIDVNDLFLMLVNDYRLTSLYQSDVTNFNTYLEGWLLFAIDEFSDLCTQSLAYDTTSQSFTESLSNRHKLILATLMTKYWLQKTVQDILQMNVNITDHDFKHYAESNNLREKRELLNQKVEQCSQLLTEYGYKNNDWDNWDNQLFRS